MNENLLNELNEIYKPMWDKSNEIKSKLMNLGFEVTSGFFNNHYVKQNNEYVVEYFPIPVIFITNIGDVGVDIHSLWVEIKLLKDKALSLDYPRLARTYKIEVYGSDNFLGDFYNEQADPYETAEKIKQSDELMICIGFTFETDVNTDEIIKIVQLFAV